MEQAAQAARITQLGFTLDDALEALRNAEGDLRSAQFLILGTKTGSQRKIDTLTLLGFDRAACEREFFTANRDIKEAARALLTQSESDIARLGDVKYTSREVHEVRGLTTANAKNVLQHYAVTHCLAQPRYERSASALGPFSASVTIGDREVASSGIHRRAVDAELSAAYNACAMLAKTTRDFAIPEKLARW
jgi:hypothetical protein